MTTVYRKSSKGQQEIETRANRLGPRLRTALILVDGRRSDADLRALIQQEADATMLALLEGGYIEVVSATAVAPPVAAAAAQAQRATVPGPAAPAAAAAAPAAVVAPGAPAMAAAAQINPAALADRRRLAVRHLTDKLGPMAEDLALRIEKTRSWPELRNELELGRTVLARARGNAAAASFAAQFMELPPG
jgi:hypothetical protein